jgi:hypothetical protein
MPRNRDFREMICRIGDNAPPVFWMLPGVRRAAGGFCLQRNLGIPLPASTQWDIVEEAAKRVAPAYAALIEEAAQGDVLHNDDTPMKILELMKKKERKGDDG